MEKSINGFFSRHNKKLYDAVRKYTVGIAGCGGLGSNIAFALVRIGIKKIVMADFDVVEPHNLNRQQFFTDQIGRPKAEALADNLKRISPYTDIDFHVVKISENNIDELFGNVEIMAEAFDRADMKKMLIEEWLINYPEKPIVAASGIAGYGRNDILKTRKIGDLYVCGDESSELEENVSPTAPRVALVANMQANQIIEIIMEKEYGRADNG